jgi:hypothetical protein
MTPEHAPQRVESTGLFAPGAAVFVVLHKDPFRERIDVRASRVLDQEGDVLFLAQTEPPVPEFMRGAEVEIAALPAKDVRPRRPVGYAARLLDLREDFPAGPEEHPGGEPTPTPALAVSAPAPGDLFETSLRMHHRVPVEPEMNVVLQLAGGFRVELLDFSAGGARARVFPPEPQAPPTWPVPPLPRAEEEASAEALEELSAPAEGEPDAELSEAAAAAAVADPSETPPLQPADPRELRVGQSVPFRLLFLGNGFAEGDALLRSVSLPDDGDHAVVGMSFTNMEIRDIRYMERMVARTVSVSRQRERDADYV